MQVRCLRCSVDDDVQSSKNNLHCDSWSQSGRSVGRGYNLWQTVEIVKIESALRFHGARPSSCHPRASAVLFCPSPDFGLARILPPILDTPCTCKGCSESGHPHCTLLPAAQLPVSSLANARLVSGERTGPLAPPPASDAQTHTPCPTTPAHNHATSPLHAYAHSTRTLARVRVARRS